MGYDRKQAADRWTQAFGGESIWRAGIAAALLLMLASGVGTLLAAGASRWSEQIKNSEIVTHFTGSVSFDMQDSQKLLETPQDIESLFAYLNALAPAVNNVEVLPGRQISSFTLLQESARETQVSLERFWMEDSQTAQLYIACAAPTLEAVECFTDLLRAADDFAGVELLEIPTEVGPQDGQQHVTIRCTFSSLF